jgi:hypothetical protein
MEAQLMLDDRLLQDYAATFFGYGNYQAPFWFIGLEEGGGGSFTEIEGRLTTWQDRGRQELEDVYEYHVQIGARLQISAAHWFGPSPRLQSTWKQLCRIALTAKGQSIDNDALRYYQAQRLGRRTEETCLLELLPLPSPGTDRWLYKDLSQRPELADRSIYANHYAMRRAAHIQQRVAEYCPPVVTFYGIQARYREWWGNIADAVFDWVDGGWYRAVRAGTLYLVIAHPAAKGVTNDYFDRVGQVVQEWMYNRDIRA